MGLEQLYYKTVVASGVDIKTTFEHVRSSDIYPKLDCLTDSKKLGSHVMFLCENYGSFGSIIVVICDSQFSIIIFLDRVVKDSFI